jgi:hypothetical protein
MNPLAAISKNLRELEKAWGQIKTPETMEKARDAWHATHRRVCPMREPEGPVVSAASVEGEGVSLTVTFGEKQDAPQSVSVGPERVYGSGVGESFKDGVTTVFPADYKPITEEPAVEGDLPGQTGTFYPETVTAEPEVNWIGGWPEYAQVKVVGLFPNRRSLKGSLSDGRTVHVERKMGWEPGEVRCRLIYAGAAPRYRTMA